MTQQEVESILDELVKTYQGFSYYNLVMDEIQNEHTVNFSFDCKYFSEEDVINVCRSLNKIPDVNVGLVYESKSEQT